MDFILEGHDCEHAIQTVIQIFCQNEGYKRIEALPEFGRVIISRRLGDACLAQVYSNGRLLSQNHLELGENPDKRKLTQTAAKAVYNALSEATGYRPPWGALTGVRPAKIVTELLDAGFGEEYAAAYLKENYYVRQDKADLCLDVSRAERRMLKAIGKDGAGVYAGIPFCPTRCGYCSFTSYPLGKFGALCEDYFNALFKELDYLGGVISGMNLPAVYVGGGTPTSVSPALLQALMERITAHFGYAPEFTVEAGRPDTITREKLEILKSYGVTRLSVNPQTMSDITLERIGRNHTASDFLRAYEMAVSMGFDDINCDVILGLPGETPEDAERTFRELGRLRPKSVTVHTLAIKRAAELNKSMGRYGSSDGNADNSGAIGEMLSISRESCRKAGLEPYYMYRQKNMVGNFENVGYAAEGYESVYNVQTMSEAQSVFAAGAGAVTKLIDRDKNLIRRAFNVKSLNEYIQRIDEMINRKKDLLGQ